MRALIVLLGALLLSACLDPDVLPQKGELDPQAKMPHRIVDDTGGNVLAYLAERERLRRWGGPVQISGLCASACTAFITLPNACLAPNAKIGFHSSRLPGVKVPVPMANAVLAGTYRGGIRRKYEQEWSKSLTSTYISAQEYVKLDPQTRLCW